VSDHLQTWKTRLEDEESLVIEINSPSLEQSLNFGKGTLSAVDRVLARVVLERMTSHDELRIWNDFEVVWTRLENAT
jgi:hypothetical protein